MKKAKRDIFRRVNLVLLLMLIAGAAIIAQVLKIQIREGNHWEQIMRDKTRTRDVKGERGDILSEEGEILVVSLPYNQIAMDPLADGLLQDKDYFWDNIDGLCKKLSQHFGDKSPQEYKNLILTSRKKESRNRNIILDEAATTREVKEMETWPIFERGQFKGGFIVRKYQKRIYPYGELAKRTLGCVREDLPSVGIEAAYDNWLNPEVLPISQINTAGNNWIDVEVLQEYPEDGHNIHTTLNLELQTIVHEALYKSLDQFQASHGCVVVLEVETGKVKAMVNLTKDGKNGYSEKYNYAVGTCTPPGSTFKPAVALALLEDNKASLNTFVNVEGGKYKFYDVLMRDDHPPAEDEMTLQRCIEHSSNVGIAKLANDAYPGKDGARQLTKSLEYMMLNRMTGIKIPGEGQPYFTRLGDPNWSGVTVPFTTIGYEVLLTPLQLTSFYNAIANDGKLMKPYLVDKVKRDNKVVLQNEPFFVKQIANLSNVKQIQKALRGVVIRGTAKGIRSDKITMAGKTGTALISKPKAKDKKYQSSFIGYFPAEKPKYTVAVIISEPQGQYYGSKVSAPVFKEIAEKCYVREYDWQQAVNEAPALAKRATSQAPPTKGGDKQDLKTIYQYLEHPFQDETISDWANVTSNGKNVKFEKRPIFDRMAEGLVPNVLGMGLRDALYELENKGFKVRHKGAGKIIQQSIPAGEEVKPGTVIEIELG